MLQGTCTCPCNKHKIIQTSNLSLSPGHNVAKLNDCLHNPDAKLHDCLHNPDLPTLLLVREMQVAHLEPERLCFRASVELRAGYAPVCWL